MEIEAKTDMTVTSLARGLAEGASKLKQAIRVDLWDVATKKELGTVVVGPDSEVKNGYAWESLPSSIKLGKGKRYRITQQTSRGMPDKWTRGYFYGTTLLRTYNTQFATFKGEVR